MKMNRTEMHELFLRNGGICSEMNSMPVIYSQDIDLTEVKLIGIHNTRMNDVNHKNYGVHCYKWDSRIENLYKNPMRCIEKLKQYRFIITPDFSMFVDMNINVQRFSVFKNRWCGNFWQRNNITVIPSVGWGSIESYSFAFDSIEKHSTVAISTLGSFRENKHNFLNGYFAMLDEIEPEAIICYGKIHAEMLKTSAILIKCLHEGEIQKKEIEFEKAMKERYPLFENGGIFI